MIKIFPEKVAKKEAEEEIDISPEQLAKEEGLLLDNLLQSEKNFSEYEFQILVNRLFEHSVADGLKYANQLHLSSQQILSAITTKDFYLKHEKLADSLSVQLSKDEKYLGIFDANDQKFIKGEYDKYRFDLSGKSILPRIFPKEDNINNFKLKEARQDLDAHYLNYLKLHNNDFGNEREEPNINLIREQLESAKLAISDNYYSGEILKIIFKKIVNLDIEELDKTAKNFFNNDPDLQAKYDNNYDRYFKALVRGSAPSHEVTLKLLESAGMGLFIKRNNLKSDLISEEELKRITDIIDLDSDIDKKMIVAAKCKPLDLVYRTRKDMAEKQLIGFLDGSLAGRFGKEKKVTFDKESDKYIIEGLKALEPPKKGKKSKVEKSVTKKEKIETQVVFDPEGGEIITASFKNGLISSVYTEKDSKLWKTRYFETDGREIGAEIDEVLFAAKVDDNTYFSTQIGSKSFLVDQDRNWKDFGTKEIEKISDINSKLYCVLSENGKSIITDQNGKEISGEYNGIQDIIGINNELYCKVKTDSGWSILSLNPEEEDSVDFLGRSYDNIKKLTNINNGLYFIAVDNDREFVVGPDDRKVSGEYGSIGNIINIKDKIYFETYDDKNNISAIVCTDGSKVGVNYKDSFSPLNINDKLYYQATDALDKTLIVCPDGREISKEIDDGGSKIINFELVNINDKIYYSAQKNDVCYVADLRGQKISGDFDKIGGVTFEKETNQLLVVGIRNNCLVKENISLNNPELNLTEEEAQQLELLNLVHKPNLEGIEKYLQEADEKKTGRRNKLSTSQARVLNSTLNNDKSLLLEFYPAKKDRLIPELTIRLLYKIFPIILENKEKEMAKNNKNSFWSRLGISSGAQAEKSDQNTESGNNCRNRESAETYEGGDPIEMGKSPEKIFSLKEKVDGIMVSNIFGKYENGKWQKIDFKIGSELNLPTKEVTTTLHNVGNTLNMTLPKTIDARIIPERVKGIKADGREINLDIQVNGLQEAVCTSREDVSEIVYSFKVSEAYEPLKNVSSSEYERFVSKLDFGRELTSNICDLPEDLQFLINSLKDSSPKEKIIAIETYVRENSHYDDNNKETLDLKRGKNITEIIDIMEFRAQELKERGDNKTHKKYAGVCADFALLTSALLREANIASGYLKGYKLNDKTATSKNSHGCSFALWPDNEGKTRLISVDGTPESAELVRIGLVEPSLEEKEKKSEEYKKEKEKSALEEFEKIEKIIASKSEAEINGLSNGQLEEVLNNILKYGVKEDNLKTIETVLSAYWYSPLKNMDLNSLDDNLKATEFLKQEIDASKLRGNPDNINFKSGEAGSKLFNVAEDFIKRFAGRKEDSKSLKQGIKVLDKVYDLSKANLSDIERKALLTTIRYLEAKNIKGVKE